jgi:cobalt-zinc-cadmium resistance protein CzcA
MYVRLLANSEKRAALGDVSRLEVLNIKAKKSKVTAMLNTLNVDIGNAYKKLGILMNNPTDFTVSAVFELLPSTTVVPDSLPVFQLLKSENDYYNSLVRVAKNQMLPDLSVNYFLGSNNYNNSKYYHGFQVGISLPLFFGSDKAKIEAAQISNNVQNLLASNETNLIRSRLSELINGHQKYKTLVDNYNSAGKPLYDEIMRSALKYFSMGEIDFYQFVNSYETAVQIQLEYFENLYLYNVSASEILYFSK